MVEDSSSNRQGGPILVERCIEENNVTSIRGQDVPQGTASADMANDAAAETPIAGKQASTGDSQGRKDPQMDAENPRPPKAKVMWGKLGLGLPTIVMMFKYALYALFERLSHKQQGIASAAHWYCILSIA